MRKGAIVGYRQALEAGWGSRKPPDTGGILYAEIAMFRHGVQSQAVHSWNVRGISISTSPASRRSKTMISGNTIRVLAVSLYVP